MERIVSCVHWLQPRSPKGCPGSPREEMPCLTRRAADLVAHDLKEPGNPRRDLSFPHRCSPRNGYGTQWGNLLVTNAVTDAALDKALLVGVTLRASCPLTRRHVWKASICQNLGRRSDAPGSRSLD